MFSVNELIQIVTCVRLDKYFRYIYQSLMWIIQSLDMKLVLVLLSPPTEMLHKVFSSWIKNVFSEEQESINITLKITLLNFYEVDLLFNRYVKKYHGYSSLYFFFQWISTGGGGGGIAFTIEYQKKK